MKWNYRVFRSTCPENGEDEYEVRSAYYEEGDLPDSEPYFWGGVASLPMGETEEELEADIRMMLDAFNRPVLILSEDKILGEEK